RREERGSTPIVNSSGSPAHFVVVCAHNDFVIGLALKPADYVRVPRGFYRLLDHGGGATSSGEKLFDLLFTLIIFWQALLDALQDDVFTEQRVFELFAISSPGEQAR